VASSAISLSEAMAEWLRTSELEDSTRKTYADYISRTIGPALGSVSIRKIDARTLENLYAASDPAAPNATVAGSSKPTQSRATTPARAQAARHTPADRSPRPPCAKSTG
jgi:integrase-like protein